MGNLFEGDGKRGGRDTPSTTKDRNVLKVSTYQVPEEPIVHGLSFLANHEKKKWREQTRKKLRVSFNRSESSSFHVDDQESGNERGQYLYIIPPI